MATLTEVTTQPASGLNHIDALLDKGPGWNWLAPTRTTIVYTFSVSPSNPTDAGRISSSVTAFNATQQAAAVAALNTLSAITGITFVASADGNAADVHFGAANITEAGVAGLASWDSSYSISGNTVSNYRADAWIYLDNAEFAATNGAPVAGNAGYQVLLHELGHAFGLKHSFEGQVTLPAAQESTAFTLMSYNASGGPYSTYNSYDIAALMWLYGGDGLGGLLGYSTASQYIVGTALVDTLGGGGGDDVFEGGAGNDAINGGAGSDTARYSGNRALYTITTVAGGFQVSGPDGTDTLLGVEKARFLDQTVVLQAGGNSLPSGTLSVGGAPSQAAVLTAISTLADSDGLGTLSYRWQQSSSGTLWNDIAGATGAGFTPSEAQVGLLLRVVGSYVDGQGNSETVNSAATTAVANVNDAPSGIVLVSGTAQQGVALSASNNLVDADGLGTIGYRWQSSLDGLTWSDVPGASGATLFPGQGQVGLRMRAVAGYTDGHGSVESVISAGTAAVVNTNDLPTGTLTITGTPQQGSASQFTSSLADADGLGALTYRWQSSADGTLWADIAGASSSSYAPGQAQVGQFLRVRANYSDGYGAVESVLGATGAKVSNVNDVPSGAVVVSGLAEQGQTLQASNTLADVDGLGPLSYEWQSSNNSNTWSAIAGATGSSFVLGASQVGQLVRALTRYTDGQGTPESVASNVSLAVLGVQTGTSGDDRLDGTAFADRLSGQGGNDRLAGHGGADQIVGGAGIDTAIFELPRASYEVAAKGVSVRALAGSEGTDSLSEIERVQFADISLAFDINGPAGLPTNGSAGLTARILGAVFGPASVSNTAYVGIGLKLLDGGTSPDALMQLALEARLGSGYSAAAEVQLLYRNLTGAEPSAGDLSYWSGQLAAGGAYTPVSLAWFAANLDLNAQNINLVGLADTGLGFT